MHPGHTLIKAVCREWRQAGSCYSPSSTPGCKQQLFVSWKLGMRHCPSSSGGQSPSVEVWSLQSQGRKERASRGGQGWGWGAPGTSCLHSQQSPRCSLAFSSLAPEEATIPLSGIHTGKHTLNPLCPRGQPQQGDVKIHCNQYLLP